MNEFPDIISLDPHVLVQLTFIVAIETVGLMEFIKQMIKHCGRSLHGPLLLIITLIVTTTCALHNTILVPPLATTVFDTVFLSLAIVQCAYQVIVKTIPKALEAVVSKVLGGTRNGDKADN